jgi:hypothetical protein
MSTRNKLYIVAGAFLLLALGILLRPPAQRPVVVFDRPAERSRPVNRMPKPATDPRGANDFHAFARRLTQGEAPELSRQEIDSFLEASHRSAGSLLAAFRLSKDEAFLREAMEKFPHDPQVLLASLQLQHDSSKRLKILESLKRADPDNRLADCLSARLLFDLGKNDEALAALSQSAGTPIRDYTILSCQDVEEAYLAAGFSPLEAKMSSLSQSTKPHLIQMRNVMDGLKKQRASDESAGNDAAVQSSRDIQMQMARELTKGPFILDSLVATVLEKGVLKEIDSPEARARIEEMELQQHSMRESSKQVDALMQNPSVPEADWLLYCDRVKLFGEKAANDWMLGKYPDL